MNRIKQSILIVLSLVLFSSIGQESKSESQVEALDSDSEHNKLFEINISNALLFKDFNDQISEVVRTIFQDSKRNIWFGTQNGAFKFNGDSLIHIHNIKSKYGKGVTIKDITEDKYGKIWFGHSDGISSVNEHLVTNYYESDGLISNDVWCLSAASNGNIWIGTIKGLCIFNGREFVNFNLPEGKMDSTRGISSTKMIHSIMEDSKGTTWFCSNAGLFSYSDNKLMNVSNKVGIKTHFVNEVFESENEELWISTKIGLFKLQDNKLSNITENKLEVGKGIGSIAKDKDGSIWFVSNQHKLYSFDGNNLIEFQKTEENKGPVIFQIYKDQDDRLWFVGYGGAYRLENGEFINITKDGPW